MKVARGWEVVESRGGEPWWRAVVKSFILEPTG
jgi:hypothetical protein